jgi:hypothetical protein
MGSYPVGARDSLSFCPVGAECSCHVVELELDVYLFR